MQNNREVTLIFAVMFSFLAVAAAIILYLHDRDRARRDDLTGSHETSFFPQPRSIDQRAEVASGLASAFEPGAENPWATRETVSTDDAVNAWKRSGSKVLLIAHYGTCSYRDAGCQQWSGKSHHGGVYPVLEDLGDRIKTIYREIEERPGFYDVIYFSKADLTEELTQTEDWQRGRDDSSVESSWSNQWSFLGPLPEKFLAKPKREKFRKLPAGTSA